MTLDDDTRATSGSGGGARAAELEPVLTVVAGEESADVATLQAQLAAVVDELSDLRLRITDTGIDPDEVHRCRAMLREHTSVGDAVLVVSKGQDAAFAVEGRRLSSYPQTPRGTYAGFHPAESAGALAHLDALRYAGHRYLLIPESSRWWCTSYPRWWSDLLDRSTVVADEPGAGALVALDRGAGDGAGVPATLDTAIDEVAKAVREPVAVLDVTGTLPATVLGAHCVFAPPPGGHLPYLDGSVDVVVTGVGDPSSGGDAARIARCAVIVVDEHGQRPVSIERLGDVAELTSIEVAVVCHDAAWAHRVGTALARDAGVVVVDDVADRDQLVLVVEPGVVPLPGCVGAVVGLLRSDGAVGGVGVKVFDAEGAIESAGDMVFADGSQLPIAHGTFDTAAAWHEYVRDICGASGIVALRGDVAARWHHAPGRGARDAAAEVWSLGHRLAYQPDAHAVRVGGISSHGTVAPAAWGGRVASRPSPAERPGDHAGWAVLLRGDDPARSWM